MLSRTKRLSKQNPPPPPTPVVTPTIYADTFNVRSRRSGNTYVGKVNPDGTVSCGCRARGECYHLPYLQRAADIAALSDGDRVLVAEEGGNVWHTALGSTETMVSTLEVPTGFRHAFVVRVERAERRAAA